MSVKDWADYLWNLLPRPYKIYEVHHGDEGKTEIKKYTEALSHELDAATNSILDVRNNWFVHLMDDALLDTKGWERGKMTRFPKETDEEYRARILNAFNWFKLGGTVAGIKHILQSLGYRDIRITERVNEEQWAEFAVDVTLPYGEFLVREAIERVEYIVNEIKAAHTKLVSTNLIYDPPDIGLDPDHVHRYDYCYYDLGLWPRPTETWLFTDGEISGITRSMRETIAIKRIVVNMGFVYGYTRYDELLRHYVWKHLASREHMGYVDRTWRDRLWRDPGAWEGKSNIPIASDEQTRALRHTFSFSQGMYDGEHPMDSLNCVYGPRYRFIDDIGVYGVTKYDAYLDPPEYRPIYRYYRRWVPLFGTIADATSRRYILGRKYLMRTDGSMDTASVFKLERTYGRFFPVFDSRYYQWGDSRWDDYRWGDEFGVRWSPSLVRSYITTSGIWDARRKNFGCLMKRHPSKVTDLTSIKPRLAGQKGTSAHIGFVSALSGHRGWYGRWDKHTWQDEGHFWVPNAYVKREER